MNVFQSEGAELLVKALLSLRNETECRAFLEDLMTGREIEDCAQRLLVARFLRERLVYSRIAQRTGASSATISRVNRACTYGTGGYGMVLNRLDEWDGLDKLDGEEGAR